MRKVMVFGTFDGIHKGHLSFLRQAKKQSNYLIAIVARDKYVKEAKSTLPKRKQHERLSELRKLAIVDKAILGSNTHNFYRTIRTYKPDIIALGYDQKPTINSLKQDFRRHRIRGTSIVRLRSYKPEIYKSSKLNYEKVI